MHMIYKTYVCLYLYRFYMSIRIYECMYSSLRTGLCMRETQRSKKNEWIRNLNEYATSIHHTREMCVRWSKTHVRVDISAQLTDKLMAAWIQEDMASKLTKRWKFIFFSCLIFIRWFLESLEKKSDWLFLSGFLFSFLYFLPFW